MNHNKIASPYILYTLLIILFISCGNRNTLFHEYVAINNEEWYYDDSLHFEIDSENFVPAQNTLTETSP